MVICECINYEFEDTKAHFPGDSVALATFIKDMLYYPENARLAKEQGIVYIRLTVERDGSISKTKVLKGVSSSLDQEALRIVNLMPNWMPETNNGKPIRTNLVLPISFKLI